MRGALVLIWATVGAGPTGAMQDKMKAPFYDLKNAQIKILSFLTYLLRQFPGVIRPHQARLHFLLALWVQVLLN